MAMTQRMVSRLALRPRTRWQSGAIGLAMISAISALGGLAAPSAQAQSRSLLDCLRRAGTDAYAVARCRNPNAQPPNLEEPITPSPSSSSSGSPVNSPSSSSSASPRSGAGPARTPTATQPYRPGLPASSYNSANRARVTIDCLSQYSEQPNAVLSACGAWGPNRQPTTPASPTAAPAPAR